MLCSITQESMTRHLLRHDPSATILKVSLTSVYPTVQVCGLKHHTAVSSKAIWPGDY